jgi:hypothetical protein
MNITEFAVGIALGIIIAETLPILLLAALRIVLFPFIDFGPSEGKCKEKQH